MKRSLYIVLVFFSTFTVGVLTYSHAAETGYNTNYDAQDPNLSLNFRRPQLFRPLDETRKRMDLATMKATSHTIVGIFSSTYPNNPEYNPEAVGDIVIGTRTFGVYYATCTGNSGCWKLIPGTTQSLPVATAQQDVDNTTAAAAKIDFNEGSGNTTIESVNSLTGKLFTSNNITTMWVSTGANSTSAVRVNKSTGTITFPDNDSFSGHAGASGKMTVCFTISPQTLPTGTNYINRMYASGSDYEFYIGYDIDCGGGPGLVSTFYTSIGAGVGCSRVTDSSFTASQSTSVCVVYDAAQSVNKVIIYVGTRKPAQNHQDPGGSTSNGVGPLWIGRNAADSVTDADAVIDRVRFYNYVFSQGDVNTYNNDIFSLP